MSKDDRMSEGITKKPRRNSIEARLLKLPHPAELSKVTPDEQEMINAKLTELKNISDEGLRNYQKNMSNEALEKLNRNRLLSEIDEMATMGSDSDIIYKQNPNYDYKLAEKAARSSDLNRLAAETELGQRGYETLLGLRDKIKGYRNPSKLFNKLTGKTLKNLLLTGAAGTAGLLSEAAEAGEEGSLNEESAMQRERMDDEFRKAVGDEAYYAGKENLRNMSPMDLLDPMANKPQFRNLRGKLK